MLTVEALNTEYRNELGQAVKAAQDVSLRIGEGEFFTLLGPSGCGKTTTLRSIAGLERPKSGEIRMADTVIFSGARNIFVPPNQRGFGMVFQSYAIWPHMSVFANAAFPLEVSRKRRFTRAQIEEKVMRVLAAVQLDHLRDRPATKLSGGQQQRLALARALVMEPKLLLLDEPLSNLDAKLREAMRFELKRLQRELRISTIYVTHDQAEALAMSHQIAVMDAGRIQQVGPPREIYERPRSKFVADFVGATNFVEGRVLGPGADSGTFAVESALGTLTASATDPLQPGSAVVLSVRPEDLYLGETRPDALNAFEAVLAQQIFLGETVDVQLRIGERLLLAKLHPAQRMPTGTSLWATVDPRKLLALPGGVV